MTAAIQSRRSPLPVNQPPADDRSKILRQIRFLIWTYLILLIFEGTLRKWIVPQLSNPILLIRDPVVVLIYLWALRAHIFPHNLYMVVLGIVAVLSLFVSIVVLLDYFPLTLILEVTLYGFRSNFLHLPLIFIMPKVFDEEDVKKIGWFILMLMIPMSLLMVAQFKASPDSFINRRSRRSIAAHRRRRQNSAAGNFLFHFWAGFLHTAGHCVRNLRCSKPEKL